MGLFIELTTEPFEQVFAQRARATQGGGSGERSTRAGSSSVRRPLRGIEIKEDTYAIIKVIRADGQEIPMFDSSRADGFSSGGYSNFILQSVQEAREEKAQVVPTFGDNYIFFFGEDPRYLDCTAKLINTHDFNWRAEWWANYNAYMRGSKLAELGARLYLFYDDIIVEGYLMSSRAVENSMNPYELDLAFRLFVTNHQNISFVGNPNFPIRSSVSIPENISLTDGNAGAQLTALYRGEALDQAELENFDRQFLEAENAGALATEGDEGPVNPLASGSRISKLIRSAPASFAVSQGVWDFLFNTATIEEVKELRSLIVREGNPLRGLIAENLDEFTGGADMRTNFGFEPGELRPPSTLRGTVRDQQEADDLFREAIQFLSCYGADINDPSIMISLGLGPNFKPQVNVSDGATFNPTGEPTPLDDFLSNAADKIENSVTGVADSFDSFARDPLGAIYGSDKENTSLVARSKYTEGAGDPLYGYPSDFADGQPGFGIPGFGDLGGAGFGSALGPTGDPGFKDPSKFTFAGVANNQGAFDRFIAPKEDTTSLSITGGIGLGSDGLTGGASAFVDGEPSSFALISIPGSLDDEAIARQRAEAIAERQEQQKFGFSLDNPYGINCPSPDSDGLSFSWP